MDKKAIHEYLKENLRLEVAEKSYGFNGTEMTFTLKLGDDTLSEESFDVKKDDG